MCTGLQLLEETEVRYFLSSQALSVCGIKPGPLSLDLPESELQLIYPSVLFTQKWQFLSLFYQFYPTRRCFLGLCRAFCQLVVSNCCVNKPEWGRLHCGFGSLELQPISLFQFPQNKSDPVSGCGVCQYHNCIIFSCSSSQRCAITRGSHLNANLPFKNPPLARGGGWGGCGDWVKLLEPHRCRERQARPPLLLQLPTPLN